MSLELLLSLVLRDQVIPVFMYWQNKFLDFKLGYLKEVFWFLLLVFLHFGYCLVFLWMVFKVFYFFED